MKVDVDGISCWVFSLSQYVQGACENVSRYLKNINKDVHPNDQTYFMPRKVHVLFKNDYCLEIDVSNKLSPKLAAYYKSLIEILRWVV